jgi:hypothetical protein
MKSAAYLMPELMKKSLTRCAVLLLAGSACASVQVYVEEGDGKAWIKYHCTAGELVRAFALDVTVTEGQITNISDFSRGESTITARGYGFFPASFRDHITVTSGTNINWNVSTYTPLAVQADQPTDTQPGLNSTGVTLEFGALWAPNVAAAMPLPSGVLCALQISQPAQVSVAANQARSGVVSALAENIITPVFNGAFVDPSVVITGIVQTNGIMKITFKGGELDAASGMGGPWSGTGNRSGTYIEPLSLATPRFFRVRRP